MTSLQDLRLDLPVLEPDDGFLALVAELSARSRTGRRLPACGFAVTGTDRSRGSWSIRPRRCVTRRRRGDR